LKDKIKDIKKIKEHLFYKKKHASLVLAEKEIKKADAFCEDYKNFLDKAKTERESVKESVALAEKAGFKNFDYKIKYSPGEKVYYINRNKAVILAIIGKKGLSEGARIAASHIDSPRIDLKPNPLYESNDLALFKTHYYGGIKKYQWLAVPLALHGVIIKKDGECVEVSIGEKKDEPCFCITDLLPHLSKEQLEKTAVKFIAGEDLNLLVGSRPFSQDEKEKDLIKLNILNILNGKYKITEQDFLSAELEIVPAFKAVDIGFDRSLIGAYGHDDRVCSYAALKAILDCKKIPENTVITILADKEEIGSAGNTGLDSLFLKYFISDLAEQESLKSRHVLSRSKCLSADVNAAFDPNFASSYEKSNACYINHGVVLTKYTGSRGKSGASDASAEFVGEIRDILNKNKIVWQTGELGKVDGGGGGTVAQYIANLNVDVVDLGVPVLSMHAPMEIVSKTDVYMTYLAVKAFFEC